MFFRGKFFSFCLVSALATVALQAESRTITVKEYRDKMAAGWVGQIVGVCVGAPTEFKWGDKIIPLESVPAWKPTMINDAFGQDDLYVEMTFLRTLEEYGLECSIRQAGIDFANSEYPLWCANDAGRKNLRKGIAPPDSSHPQFNKCPNDIDYQIEADYSGLIAPGIPQAAVDLGEKFGRLMNYSDGLYAGQFMGALYAEAFFETDRVKLVEKALKAIPQESQYAEMARDMLKWYQQYPGDWEATWRECQKKYRENPEYQKSSNGGIDCKINGAYVLLGFLYGEGDLMETIVISCRGGMDSDCNPSSSAGVLFTTVGFEALPKPYTELLDRETRFNHTAYNYPALLDVSEKLARQVVLKYGGKITRNDAGEEIFVIPDVPVKPSKMVNSWDPEPIEGSKFTPEEMAKIKWVTVSSQVKKATDELFPGWQISNCGEDMNPGIRQDWQGEKNVLCVHPLDRETGCSLKRTIAVGKDKKTLLRLQVGRDPQGDFDLIVKAAGKELYRGLIGKTTTENHWLKLSLDLSEFAGKDVELELINQANGWEWEAAYWKTIEIVEE
jgi:hypothetical protein